jgi:diguanylate cyclase (GGDEF)-like protein
MMQKLGTALYHNWIKQILLVSAVGALVFLTYLCLTFLNRIPPLSSPLENRIALVLFLYLIPIALAWLSNRIIAVSVLLPSAAAIAVLAASVTQIFSFLIVIVAYVLLCLFLFILDQRKDARVIDAHLAVEKSVNEKNDLELAYKEKGTSISVFFEKYTSYYNLRNLATDFSATLSLKELCTMIVARAIELIQKGGQCLLLLSEPETGNLCLMASKNSAKEKSVKLKGGDLFDFWVLRNRQSLIVQDTHKDFRFDLKKTSALTLVRSLIAAPIVHEGKTVGALRVQRSQPSAFTTDDLRILDAITTLGSSAVSNSILFQKTEELAIRDSLTGLYVQRYFKERLAQEHRRSLITNAPLALLMCDLDRFKSYNDRHGHGIGDLILTRTAAVLKENVTTGIVSRYGGEEFAVLLPQATMNDAREAAESLRRHLIKMNLTVRREIIPITISIGVACLPDDTLDSEELIRVADKRLYRAKREGRDRVCCDG